MLVHGEMDGIASIYAFSTSGEIALAYSDPEMLWVRDMVKTEYGYLVASTRNEQTKIVKTDFELNPLSFSMLDGYCRAIYATEEGNILIALQTSNSDHKILKIESTQKQYGKYQLTVFIMYLKSMVPIMLSVITMGYHYL